MENSEAPLPEDAVASVGFARNLFTLVFENGLSKRNANIPILLERKIFALNVLVCNACCCYVKTGMG